MTSEVTIVHARRAARNGDLSAVEAWLSQGGDVNTNNAPLGYSSTLLTFAILGRQTQMCEYLLARGARCGKSDIHHLLYEILECPSHVDDIARLFIEHGADPALGSESSFNRTRWGTPHKLAVIVSRNSTSLERYVQSRCAPLIRLLVEKGAPVDARLGESTRFAAGTTPLMVAVFYLAPVNYLRELLRLGADLNATNERGESALSLARSKATTAMTDELRPNKVADKRAIRKFLNDVSAAGTFKRYVNEPRKQLFLLAKLCERRRATAPWGVLRRLFPTRRSRRAPPRDDGGSFQRASAETLRTRRVVSVADRFRGLSLDGEGLPDELIWKVLSFWRTSRDGPPL
jgi:hypothetical protein